MFWDLKMVEESTIIVHFTKISPVAGRNSTNPLQLGNQDAALLAARNRARCKR